MKKLKIYDYYLFLCLLLWIVMLIRLQTREFLEFVDAFSFLIYILFIVFYVLIFVLKIFFRNDKPALRAIFWVSVLPSVLSGIIMFFVIFGLIMNVSRFLNGS
ncbi:MAG: hypothetical protein C0592_11010 [Marinilabiliales bacterium]|nr:MAG: hypothetical protein C0592_11010 [Marinilabiliales bacterium]